MWRKRVLVFALSLVGSSLLPAQTPDSQAPLTLSEALRLAQERSLKLQQQRATQAAAQLRTEASKTARLPSVGVSGFSFYLSQVPQINFGAVGPVPGPAVRLGGHIWSNYTLSLQQPIFTGFRIQSQIQLAETAELSEAARLRLHTNEVSHQVTLLFYQAQNRRTNLEILETSVRRLDLQLQNVRNLFEAAQVMAFDTLQVYNQKLAVHIQLENAALEHRLALLQLARLLDLPEVRPVAALRLEKPDRPGYALEQLQRQALENRPELESVRLGLAAAEIRTKLARATYYPNISIAANYHVARPGLDPVANQWMDFFSVVLNVDWNLWRWGGDRKQVEAAQADRNRLSLQERELLRTIEYQVSESYQRLMVSFDEIEMAEQLVRQETERYDLVALQHEQGVASTNDLIAAETDLRKSELQFELALLKYYVNEANLRFAVGNMGALDPER